MDIGCNKYVSLSQPSIFRIIHQVTDAVNTEDILNDWIVFPSTYEELMGLRNGYI